MANTTNYNWETPDDTDLVKDGAAAIRTLGSSVDTTTKALNPSTTLGDIEYRSATANTNTRLPIGTTGQILSVVGGVPSWVANDVGDITAVSAGTGISGGGTSGDITITNSMATAIDAKGDLIVGTGADTFSRLAAGTNTYILTADSAEATGLKWAAPAGATGGLTKITSAQFTTQSSVAVNGCFTSTYKMYYVIWQAVGSVSGADMQLQFQYSTSTAQTSDNYGSGFGYDRGNALFTFGFSNTAATTLYPTLTGSTNESFGSITFNGVGNSSENPIYFGTGYGQSSQSAFNYSGYNDVARTYTGFLLKCDTGTITGSYQVYGLEN